MTAPALDAACAEARRVREEWLTRNSAAVATVVESVLVGDGLSFRVDESDERVGELADRESESSEAGRSVGEFTLSDPGGVGGLESVPLGMHEQVEHGVGFVGSRHGAEPTDDCAVCTAARRERAAWVAERAA